MEFNYRPGAKFPQQKIQQIFLKLGGFGEVHDLS